MKFYHICYKSEDEPIEVVHPRQIETSDKVWETIPADVWNEFCLWANDLNICGPCSAPFRDVKKAWDRFKAEAYPKRIE